MTHSIRTFTSVFTLLVVSAFASQTNADEYRHIDQLAVKIQRYAKRLQRETVHYRHTPEYRHLVADANAMYRLATHVHDVTHFEGNLAHLQRDVDALDRQFHHIESVFDRVEHNVAFGEGHVHGNTAHVKRLLDSIEDSIHHMKIDLQEIRNRTIVARPICTLSPTRPTHRGFYSDQGSRGYGYGGSGYGGVYRPTAGGFGFSFGGTSSRINFHY